LQFGENDMNYLLLENEELVGVCDYVPNIGEDNIKILPYSGNIPKERILYINGSVEDSNNYTYLNGKLVKKTKAVEKLVQDNAEATDYLTNTDWLVIRHRDQVDLNQTTSLTNEQYLDLLAKRQQARDKVINYGE
jgi:hypothetical protein